MAEPDIMARLGVAHLTWKRHLQEGLVPHEITLKQLYVLRQLHRRRFLYPSRIAEELFTDRPTATVVIRNLERAGWVERRPDPDDGRRVRVVLTPAGRQKLQKVQRSPEMEARREFDPLACFDAEERRTLARLLERLNERLRHLRRRTNDPSDSNPERTQP